MEDWMAALKVTASRDILNQPIGVDLNDFLSGNHSWHTTSHARPTYCNICREQLSGVTSHGYSCEVCKCKVHKRCVDKAISNCKWTTLASVGKDIIEDKQGNILMIHQWMEGNLPVSSKCAVCDKTCGSVLRLQDWRCLWCRATVHTACRPKHTIKCPLGSNRLSVVPPTAIHSVASDDSLEAIQPHGCSPLLVFVNSKSGDNQGIKFLRRFKQILNPAQVFDLIGNGPGPGLRLFRHFNPFRVLVCSGDGSVGWVLSEIDRLNMQVQCHVGVLPLGTGNDLARVLGWGASCDDDAHLPQIMDKYERASTKILDRWSIMVYERSIDVGSGTKLTMNSGVQEGISLESAISTYYNYIMTNLNIILQTHEHETIVNTAKVLCGTVKDFIVCISEINNVIDNTEFNEMRQDLKYKLDTLLKLLQKEEFKITYQTKNEIVHNNDLNEENMHININKIINNNVKDTESKAIKKVYKKQLLERANSLEKSVTKLIEHSGKAAFPSTIVTPLAMSELLSPSIDNNLNLQQLTPTSIANPISISPIPMLRRESSSSTELNIESLPVPVEFSDSRQEIVLDDQNAVMSEEDTSTYQTSQYDDLNSYCQIYETDKLKNECKDQISEPLKTYPAFKISEEETLGNICHIDSSEASDEIPDSYKMCDNKCPASSSRYSFRQACQSQFSRHRPKLNFGVNECTESDVDVSNLISSSPDDEESEDFRKELIVVENSSKKCSIAHFIEGNDIARRSIKCRHLNKTYSDMETDIEFGFKNITNESEKCAVNKGLEVPNESKLVTDKNEINVRIQGSNGNISTNGDNSFLLQDPKPTSDVFEADDDDDDDDELHSFKGLKRSQTMTGPAVVINPPSPQNFSPNKLCDVEESHLDCRRNSFDSCRRLSAASPVMLNASPLRASHRISSSTALNNRNHSPTPCSVQNYTSLKRNKHLPIINPLVTLPTWPNVTESSLISQVLLANADALCAPAVPLMDPDETLLEGFFEKCIMNNYFGIGIDAKISLDFHHKREEHPEKCRSRTRNYMWYGVLGSKQWLQKTYKNLDQRVQLECDGQRIPLPSLQGIVILNIPSFMGGTNFWGGTKEDRVFLAPSIDDRILEVVAVFGTIQMAASRLINLQHHRIAQCTTVQINIMGDEGVPIQVDGEAWVQPPGMIRIIHKNRMKMLCRNKALELSLKSWEEKQKQIKHQSKRTHSQSLCRFTPLSHDEWTILKEFLDATNNLTELIREILLKQKLFKGDDLKKLTDSTNDNVKKISIIEHEMKEKELRSVATDIVLSTKRLHEETLAMIRNAGNVSKQNEFAVFDGEFVVKLSLAFSKLENEFKKCLISSKDSEGDNDLSSCYVYFLNNAYETDKLCRKGQFWQKLWKANVTSSKRLGQDISNWSTVEVGIWLESVQLGEYTEVFANNDIRGKELLNLSRRDLKEIGITKVGHLKRILMAIKELSTVHEDH